MNIFSSAFDSHMADRRKRHLVSLLSLQFLRDRKTPSFSMHQLYHHLPHFPYINKSQLINYPACKDDLFFLRIMSMFMKVCVFVSVSMRVCATRLKVRVLSSPRQSAGSCRGRAKLQSPAKGQLVQAPLEKVTAVSRI